MMSKSELLKLAERVEAGSGEDRDLDIAILRVFNPDHVMFEDVSPDTSITFTDIGSEWKWNAFYRNGGVSIPFQKACSSLDAVEALRERLLPGSEYAISMANNCAAHVWLDHFTNCDHVGHAETAPRAFLAALLRAYAETVGG